MQIFALLSGTIQNFLVIIAGVCGLGFLIGFHELGHFIFCKLFQIKTPSFSIGFGPRIFSKKMGDTLFSLSAIPFGGYVEIAGAAEVGQGDQEHAQDRDKYSFAIKPFYQKMLVMFGGILFNLLFAYVALIGIFFAGLPNTKLLYSQTSRPIIAEVQKDSAAEKNGLIHGDVITAINGIKTHDSTEVILNTLKEQVEQPVSLDIQRNQETFSVDITPQPKDVLGKTVGSIGVIFETTSRPGVSFFESIQLGIQETNRWIVNTFNGFAHIFHKKNVNELSGPLMIVAMTIKGASEGIKVFLLFLAIISVNLAVLNLIPLPILDGGQILFYSIEAIIRRPLPERVREYIHLITWGLFIILFLYLSFKDITRIAQPYIGPIMKFFGAE